MEEVEMSANVNLSIYSTTAHRQSSNCKVHIARPSLEYLRSTIEPNCTRPRIMAGHTILF